MDTTQLRTKLEITSWDETAYRDLPDGQKLARASVGLSGGGTGAETGVDLTAADLTAADLTMLLHYRADDTSTYVSLMWVEGTVNGRTGGFALTGTGTYDGTQARVELTVVPGSGTGDLAGIQGTGTSVSSHADYPYMPLTLDYRLA